MVGESGGDRRFKLFTSRGDVSEETRGGDAVEDFVRRRAHERVAHGRARALDAHRVRARLSSPYVARAERSRRRHRGRPRIL